MIKYKTRAELVKEVKELRKICKELIQMPKGVESHRYSDYKILVKEEERQGYALS